MSRPWMPLYVADYLRDTRKLTAAEHGAYLLLIMEYWTVGNLPDDDRQLARIASMSTAEWRKARPNVQVFFHDGWKHKRIDGELAKSAAISIKRAASAKQKHSKSSAFAEQVHTHARASSQPQSQKEPEAIASDAGASPDHRKRLFDDGLKKLASLTGKGPDACRSFVGKCLKAAGDDAVTVIGLIEEAERNQVVDPSAWIAARLKPQGNFNGPHQSKPGVVEAFRQLGEQVQPRGNSEGGANAVLRLPAR